MSNKFDYENLYTKENATIIENLLDRVRAPFDELISIFSLNIPDSVSSEEFLTDSIRMVQEDPDKTIDKNTVEVDKILPLLIKCGDIPVEICRLPRLSPEQIDFNIIEDYYEREINYVTGTKEEIVNYRGKIADKQPTTLSFSEATARLAAAGLPLSLIKNSTLPMYLAVQKEDVITDNQSKSMSSQSITYFRQLNCGNPKYTKRYRGLERLTVKDSESLLNGDHLLIKTETRHYLEVQTTDMETKFHLRRLIKPLVRTISKKEEKVINVIRPKDVCYLEQDINALIACELQKRKTPFASDTQESRDEASAKKTRRRLEKHPGFLNYIKKDWEGKSYTALIDFLRSEGYVFGDDPAYNKHINNPHSEPIIGSDNSSFYVKNVAIVKASVYQDKKTNSNVKKEVICYRLPPKTHPNEHKRILKIPLSTCKDYFYKNKKA